MNKKGFSLVEALIITLVVSGALAASLPALTTKVQENDKSISALGIKDPRYWNRTKSTGDHIYYNGTVGVYVDNKFINEESEAFKNTQSLVLGAKTGEIYDNLSAIIGYGKLGAGDVEPPTGSGTKFFWSSKYGAFRAGYLDSSHSDYWNPSSLGKQSIAIGYNNEASGSYSNVYGGLNNRALEYESEIYGGRDNTVNASNAKIYAGYDNVVDDPYSEIYGGENNKIEECTALNDTATEDTRNIIAGGLDNTITENANYSIILGGEDVTVDEPYTASIGNVSHDIKTLTTKLKTEMNSMPAVWNPKNVNQVHFFKEFSDTNQDLLKVQDEDGRDEDPQWYMTFIFDDSHYLLINKNGVTETFTTTSDRRLKRDIKPYANSLNAVLKLKPVVFKYKNDESQEVVDGFIAQDIKKIFPKAVSIAENNYYQLEGVTLFNKIRLSLVNATKELAGMISDLEKDSAKMTSDVEEMKARLEKLEKVKPNA